MLLIATLALMVAWLMGKATELTGQHRHYQANTVRNRVVLSTIFVGLKVIDDARLTLRLVDLLAAIARIVVSRKSPLKEEKAEGSQRAA